jgi:hypothetical protein
LFEDDRFLIKFHNLWTIEAPEGYALLFTHPVNRFDLPFTTLTGLVDCDRYHDNWIHFPAHWHDASFSGVLPKGTPVAQCLPVKREKWQARTIPFTRRKLSARMISQPRLTGSQASIGDNSGRNPVSSFAHASISRRRSAAERSGHGRRQQGTSPLGRTSAVFRA